MTNIKEMTQKERDYTAKQYNHIRKIIQMKQHEDACWASIVVFGYIAWISLLTYLAYHIITMPGKFGW